MDADFGVRRVFDDGMCAGRGDARYEALLAEERVLVARIAGMHRRADAVERAVLRSEREGRHLHATLQVAQLRRMEMECEPHEERLARVRALKVMYSRAPRDTQNRLDVRLMCFNFVYSLRAGRGCLLRTLKRWCYRKPIPQRGMVDQHVFMMCKFALAEAGLRVSTRHGVSLFSSSHWLVHRLFGVDAEHERVASGEAYAQQLPCFAPKYEGPKPGVHAFNIPLRCLSGESILRLAALMSASHVDEHCRLRRMPFEKGMDDVAGCTFLYNFHFDAYLTEALDVLRPRLLALYCANMIASAAASMECEPALRAMDNVLSGLDSAYTFVSTICAERGRRMSEEVRGVFARGREIARSLAQREALFAAARRHACRRAAAYVVERYTGEELDDIVKHFYGPEFM